MKHNVLMSCKLKKIELASRESSKNNFDVTKHIRLLPPFNENEVDKYFDHFEKVSDQLKWPDHSKILLLQSVLKGKAL